MKPLVSMKRFILYFALLGVLVCCEDRDVFAPDPPLVVNFEPYVENFKDLFKIDNISSEIVLKILSSGRPGRCLRGESLRVIQINPETWAEYDEPTREALIIHELGHCELGLAHTEPNIPHIMSDFIGLNVKAYVESLEQELVFMMGPDHPRLRSFETN